MPILDSIVELFKGGGGSSACSIPQQQQEPERRAEEKKDNENSSTETEASDSDEEEKEQHILSSPEQDETINRKVDQAVAGTTEESATKEQKQDAATTATATATSSLVSKVDYISEGNDLVATSSAVSMVSAAPFQPAKKDSTPSSPEIAKRMQVSAREREEATTRSKQHIVIDLVRDDADLNVDKHKAQDSNTIANSKTTGSHVNATDMQQKQTRPIATRGHEETAFTGSKPMTTGETVWSSYEFVQVGQQCRLVVQMRSNDETRRYLGTFPSVAAAQDATNISSSLIEQACLMGGGLAGDKYFRFVDQDAKPVPKNLLKAMYYFDVVGLQYCLVQMRSSDEPCKYLATFPSISATEKATNISSSLIERACLMGGGLAGEKYFRFVDQDAKPVPENVLQARFTFDVSKLRPVRRPKTSVRPPKIIELVDKGTNEVIVCFRGATIAHLALGIDRGTVTMACLNYDTPSQPDFKTFVLRYAVLQNGPLAAYEYGAHKEDWTHIDETFYQRLARWARVVAEERSGKCTSPPAKKKQKKASPSESRTPTGKEKKKLPESRKIIEKKTSATRKQLSPATTVTTGGARIATFQGVGTTGEEVMLSDVSVPTTVVNDTDTSMVCLVCQSSKAEIVFEPCHHCVLCSDCSEIACRTFCLVCRTTITGRLRPATIRVVRPRIYSSYSFM